MASRLVGFDTKLKSWYYLYMEIKDLVEQYGLVVVRNEPQASFIEISKSQALEILDREDYNYEISIMCAEYGDDEDWVQVLPEDLETLEDEEYKTFEIWI